MNSVLNLQPRASNNKLYLVANSTGTTKAKVVVTNMAGSLISTEDIIIQKGTSNIEIHTGQLMKNQVAVVALFVENKSVFSKKVLW